jgi:hypothetical protein
MWAIVAESMYTGPSCDHLGTGGTLDMTDSGTRIVVATQTTDQVHVLDWTGSAWSVSAVLIGTKPGISGDGTRLIIGTEAINRVDHHYNNAGTWTALGLGTGPGPGLILHLTEHHSQNSSCLA